MATIARLRERSDELFTRLLDAQAVPRKAADARRAVAGEPRVEPFAWFKPEDGVAAAALSFRLAALAASGDDAHAGLGAALDLVERELGDENPERVRQGFALFVTHNREGRRLAKPRTAAAAPKLFSPPPRGGGNGNGRGQRAMAIGGLSPQLDYWREDVLANEHHQHWHEVYPFTGLPPQDFEVWLQDRTPAELLAILNALAPDPRWEERVRSSSPAELAALFARVARADAVFGLPHDLYRLLFRLNDRQGELFFYMHEQMLARYDAELLSFGLDRVEVFGPEEWDDAIAAGYNPENADFGIRDANETLPDEAVRELRDTHRRIADALEKGTLLRAGGGSVTIDRTNLGEAVEATVGQLHELDDGAYPGLHNNGHMLLSDLSQPQGVMSNPVAAIRDQVFWQWHKCIDDISASWQETQPAVRFDDAPEVLVRNSLGDDPNVPWASPDIVLCRTADLPQDRDPRELGEELFGGEANWSKDFSGADQAAAGGVAPTGELITRMKSATFGGQEIEYLAHDSFSYFLRVENRSERDLELTARIFLAPAAHAEDRRAWIEMDKLLVSLPARAKAVVHRSDAEASVVKRPVDGGPADVQTPGGPDDEGAYCDCGWPYTLLLPRGTRAGMEFRLMAMFTDATVDQVDAPKRCGSMSWCGAVDRYPDTRDMGYPFCRPFERSIADTLFALPSAAVRTITIRHA